MLYAVAYLAILLPFGVLDAVWLTVMGRLLYKPTLGDILLTNVNLPPAVAFYLLYPVGVMIFAVLPALKADSVTTAILYAALFGAFAYGTYDLTNYATVRNWTLTISLLDIAWGVFATATAATVSFYVAKATTSWIG